MASTRYGDGFGSRYNRLGNGRNIEQTKRNKDDQLEENFFRTIKTIKK